MKRIAFVLTLFGIIFSQQISAQKTKNSKYAIPKTTPAPPIAPPAANPVVFTFGEDTVYKSEFERLLYKNKSSKEAPTEKDVREYLDLYINFKLKVKEAMRMQLD